MAQGLRALAIPPKVLSSVPNTHITQLITACNSSPRALSLPSGLCTHIHIVFINSINHMYTLKRIKRTKYRRGLSGGRKKGVYLGRVGGSLEGEYDHIKELFYALWNSQRIKVSLSKELTHREAIESTNVKLNTAFVLLNHFTWNHPLRAFLLANSFLNSPSPPLSLLRQVLV